MLDADRKRAICLLLRAATAIAAAPHDGEPENTDEDAELDILRVARFSCGGAAATLHPRCSCARRSVTDDLTIVVDRAAQIHRLRDVADVGQLRLIGGSTKHEILNALEQRLQNTPEHEFQEALRQAYCIARFRLDDAVS